MTLRLPVLNNTAPAGPITELGEEESELPLLDDELAEVEVAEEDSSEQKAEARPRKRKTGGNRSMVRARTISIKRLSKRALEAGRIMYPPIDVPRPEVRASCSPDERTCPWCSLSVVMSTAHGSYISCPKCDNRVVYIAAPDGSYGEWAQSHENGHELGPAEIDPVALHHCRPCLRVLCKYNLYVDVNRETGSIKLNYPDIEPSDMEESCALDVSEIEGITLENLGEMMNLTRERIRQLETKAIKKLRATQGAFSALRDHDDDGESALKWYTRFMTGRSNWRTDPIGQLRGTK